MIFLDPELDPDPPSRRPQSAQGGVRGAGAARTRRSPSRLPSQRTIARFLARAQGVVRLRGQVSVLLTTDREVRRLNREFRGLNKPTDVLSFPAEPFVRKHEKVAGDLAISVPTARRQAAAEGHPVATELKVLILHGLLHLAGYDHEIDEGQMARRERRLRAELRLPQGLIERAAVAEKRAGAVLSPRRAKSVKRGAGASR